MDDDKAKPDPEPTEEIFSAAEIQLAALAVDAWRTDREDYRISDCVNALKTAVAFLRISREKLAGGSPRRALSALNEARAGCEHARLLLETCTGPEAESLRTRLVSIEQEMRGAWESMEAMLA
jgi:hypothetical protein